VKTIIFDCYDQIFSTHFTEENFFIEDRMTSINELRYLFTLVTKKLETSIAPFSIYSPSVSFRNEVKKASGFPSVLHHVTVT